jgi:hypothetical protein
VEDKCGVCNGDGSTCVAYEKTFNETKKEGKYVSSLLCVIIGKIYICMYISQNKEKESENSYHKLKRSLKERHMKTHGN